MTNEIINVNGINFKVVKAETAETMEAEGLKNIARVMRQNKVSRNVIAQKPTGKRMFIFNQFENGRFSKPRVLPTI